MAAIYLHRDVITALMIRYNYTASDVASLAGLSASMVRGIANGSRSSAELSSVRAIAKALRVPVSAIANMESAPETRVS